MGIPTMWRPDPGNCVAEVVEFGEHPDDVEYIRMLKQMPKNILKRREITCKDIDLKKVQAKQDKVNFSVARWPLTIYSKSSGPGDEKASIIHAFYESKDERKVLNAFSSSGIDLESAEAVPVEPNSSLHHEQKAMYSEKNIWEVSDYEHEETPVATLEEIKKKMGYEWVGVMRHRLRSFHLIAAA